VARDAQKRRRRVVALQKYLLNPPVKLAAAWGLAPGLALLETTGRRTGKPRRTVVGVHIEGNTAWLVSEQGRRSAYVQNILAQPKVRLRLSRRWREGTAAVVDDDDPDARLERFGRRAHAEAVRRLGTEPTSVRIDLH
jgi:deazaflavin-dependent oxidoreductase (nitroreductase family)